ncbi:TolC family protein [Vibrio sp. 10N.261.46.E12]|uniref:TolC family protein n=1 Tax=unclassified Vibrio TaxID=2614977 RepID=UPI001F53805B|nr:MULTISPECIES: TolC family protein [unclassified Vibrio]
MALPDEQNIHSRAVNASSEIAYAKEEVNLAKAELEQTKANPFPTLSARFEQSVFDAADTPNQDETRFGVVLNGQISGLGVSAYNQINESAERITAAQYELDSVRNEVERETKNLIVNRDLQESLRTSQQETLAALEDTMASFLRQYETNRKSWVEVLNQQRELAQMRYTVIATDQTWKELSLQIASKIGKLDAAAGMGKSL